MATIEVTDENFQEVTGRDGIVILDFWATWCGACRAFAPVYEAASEEHPDIVFGKVAATCWRRSDNRQQRGGDASRHVATRDRRIFRPRSGLSGSRGEPR